MRYRVASHVQIQKKEAMVSEMVHIHRFECHGRNKEFVPLDEYRILRDECERLRWALTFVVKTASDPELSFGDRVSVIRHTAQAALTPAAGGTRHG